MPSTPGPKPPNAANRLAKDKGGELMEPYTHRLAKVKAGEHMARRSTSYKPRKKTTPGPIGGAASSVIKEIGHIDMLTRKPKTLPLPKTARR